MIRSALREPDETKDELSEESEEQILEMVEEQLDRPNPPGTKVLYRRAMHFIDRDVRHLSLRQFNAKFPLQVKRKRAGAASEAENGAPATANRNGDGETATDSEVEDEHELKARESNSSEAEAGEVDSSNGNGAKGKSDEIRQTIQREQIRSALLRYAKLVAEAETRAELVEVVPQVDEYVDRVMLAM